MKILELFGGIGACSSALTRLGIDYEIADYVEIDKYAVASYNAIHGTSFEPQDICEWNKDIDVDLIMHGSPCQDFSVAGKGAGGDEGSGTRSSLMYETIRIVEKLKPKYVIWENVKNLLSKKHIHNFKNYISTMEQLGYNSYYQVLNAKDYGIPQNRERVFTISIRQDIDNGHFQFPKPVELKLKLKDLLEYEVDEKYYLSDKAIQGRLTTNYEKYKLEENIVNNKEIHPTILARFEGAPTLYINNNTKCSTDHITPKLTTIDIPQKVRVRKYPVDIDRLVQVLRSAKIDADITNKEIANQLDVPTTQVEHYFRTDKSFAIPDENIWFKLKEVLKIDIDDFDESIMTFEEKDGAYERTNRVYDDKGIAPTIDTGNSIKVLGNYSPSGYEASRIVDSDGLAPTVKENHGTVTATVVKEEKLLGAYGRSWGSKGKIQDDICNTLTSAMGEGGGNIPLYNNSRIRKLTPKECWRLMGFTDEEFEKAQKVNSNAQLYKQAGNSIVVNVLEGILNNLLLEDESDFEGQMTFDV